MNDYDSNIFSIIIDTVLILKTSKTTKNRYKMFGFRNLIDTDNT